MVCILGVFTLFNGVRELKNALQRKKKKKKKGKQLC